MAGDVNRTEHLWNTNITSVLVTTNTIWGKRVSNPGLLGKEICMLITYLGPTVVHVSCSSVICVAHHNGEKNDNSMLSLYEKITKIIFLIITPLDY
jgi:hypothetical protein